MQCGGLAERLHRDVDGVHAARQPDLQSVQLQRLRLQRRLRDCLAERFPQAIANHGVEVPVGLAGRGFEIVAGAPADVDDIAGAIHDHGSGRMHLQQHPVRRGLEVVVRLLAMVGSGTEFSLVCTERGGNDVTQQARGRKATPRRSVDTAAASRPAGVNNRPNLPTVSALPSSSNPPGTQAVVKQRKQPALQANIEVDQQVAACDQVELGERRIEQQVVVGKQHSIANVGIDLEVGSMIGEEARQSLGRDRFANRGRILAAACRGDGIHAQIGGEDLQTRMLKLRQALDGLREQHGDRIGLLSRGAADRPGTQHVLGSSLRQQIRQAPRPAAPRPADHGRSWSPRSAIP